MSAGAVELNGRTVLILISVESTIVRQPGHSRALVAAPAAHHEVDHDFMIVSELADEQQEGKCSRDKLRRPPRKCNDIMMHDLLLRKAVLGVSLHQIRRFTRCNKTLSFFSNFRNAR